MTIDEAIKHCEEVAEAEEQKYKEWKGDYSHLKKIDSCLECAKDYRQLAEWLKELVHLRNITEYIRDMVTCFEFMDSMHYNEDIIEWAESELRVDMREVNDDE